LPGFGKRADIFVLYGNAEPFEAPAVELNALVAEDLLEQQRADEVADCQTVGGRRFEEKVGGEAAAGSTHVVDDHGWIARDMSGHMPGDYTGVLIETATGGKADDDADCLASVEILVSGSGACAATGNRDKQKRD
jgi:hypothetical protein